MTNTDSSQTPIFPSRDEPTGAIDAVWADPAGDVNDPGADQDDRARRRRFVIGAMIAAGAVFGLAVGSAVLLDDGTGTPVAVADWSDSATDEPLLTESDVPVPTPEPTPETPETTPPDWTLPEVPEVPEIPEFPDEEVPEEGPEEPTTPPAPPEGGQPELPTGEPAPAVV